MKRKVVASVLLFSATLIVTMLGGCATGGFTNYEISVDGLGDNPADMHRYVILPGMEDVAPEDLQFVEFEKQLTGVLGSKNLVKVEDPMDAQLVIFMKYGLGDPQQVVYSSPVFGKIAGKTTTIRGDVNATAKEKAQYGVVGSAVHTATVFSRHLVLEAVDAEKLRSSGKFLPVWKTTVLSTGSSGDLRAVFPALLLAARPWIGQNTGKQIRVSIGISDPELANIRNTGSSTTIGQNALVSPITTNAYPPGNLPPPMLSAEQRQQLDAQIKTTQAAIEKDPTNQWLYFSLGKLYAIAKDGDKMEEAFTRCLEYGDRYLSDIEEQRRQFTAEESDDIASSSLTQMDTASVTIPSVNFAAPRITTSTDPVFVQQLEKQITATQKALEKDPSNAWLYFSLGKLYAIAKDEVEMEKAFSASLQCSDRQTSKGYTKEIEEQRRLFKEQK